MRYTVEIIGSEWGQREVEAGSPNDAIRVFGSELGFATEGEPDVVWDRDLGQGRWIDGPYQDDCEYFVKLIGGEHVTT